MMDGKQMIEASEGEEGSGARGEVTTKLGEVGAKMSIGWRNSQKQTATTDEVKEAVEARPEWSMLDLKTP